MDIENRLNKLEENLLKLIEEIQRLKKTIPSPDFNSWWNSLDQNWKILFRYNIENRVSVEFWWKDADYFGYPDNFQPTPKFYKKRLDIEIFSCKLKYSKIYDLTPLESLESLIGLNCSNSSVDDLTPISHMTDMKYLDIHYSDIDDLTPISKFKDLEFLNYQHNFDSKKNDLTHFTKLKSLNIRYGKILETSFLEKLTNLEYLNIGYSNMKTIKPLLYLDNLNEVYMPGTNVPESEIKELQESKPNCKISC